ncbi:MAG TPA: sigma-70 family RNA polymerase sigma factor [Candidatus Binatia bacterium]|nr:sigma-70 family RNA polymerase sigma factor [Candidatus Binatia bacterium]
MAIAGRTVRDPDTFQRLAEPYRRELQVHCYRMVGSRQDAEDLVQETYLRAWRGFDSFRGGASLRTWLYRIATNACLNAMARGPNAKRVLPESVVPPATGTPAGEPLTDVAWLEPYPDSELEGIPDAAPGPAARYEMREAVQLAFVAAIQHLPARQRAVLLLRDVLGWSAAETAGLLDTSVAAVNSALQRARATLAQRFPAGRPGVQGPPVEDLDRTLLDRYVRAWETADLDGFVSLLREDAVMTMPPLPEWYAGRDAVAAFFRWLTTARFPEPGSFRLLPTAANRQPAFGVYIREGDDPVWRAHALQVVTIANGLVAAMTSFRSPAVFAAFGLPPELRA